MMCGKPAKKLLILLLLIPIAGLGHDACKGHRHVDNGWGVDWMYGKCDHEKCNDWSHEDYPYLTIKLPPTPTFTDGFGYEYGEEGDHSWFAVTLDFDILEDFKLSYKGVVFHVYESPRYESAVALTGKVKDHPPFTHADAWAIRCKAAELVRHKELVEGKKCDSMWHTAKEINRFNFCPYCGAALQPAGEKLK